VSTDFVANTFITLQVDRGMAPPVFYRFRVESPDFGPAADWAIAKLAEVLDVGVQGLSVQREPTVYDGGMQIRVGHGELVHLVDLDSLEAMASACGGVDRDLTADYIPVEVA